MSKDEEYTGWHIDWTEDYSQFFRKDNWYTFTFIHLVFENDTMMGGYELTFVVLGLGFRIRYNHTRTELVDEILKSIDDIERGI
jgi:hypothetical protein